MQGSFAQRTQNAHSLQRSRPNVPTVSRRCARRGTFQVQCSRAENRGTLRLYLDSASVYQWEKHSQREVFYGITSNSLILKKDEVPQCNMKVYKILAKQMAEATSGLVGEPGGNPSASLSQAFDLGYQEIQLQVWGQDAKTMYGVGQDIAAIDSKVVVKVPMTGDGAAVAARLKRQKAIVTCTAIYSARQALAAVGLGADYLAPYLGRMNNAGRNGFKEVMDMNDIVKGTDSKTRVLVASIASAADVTALASQGCDTFTLVPKAADQLFHDDLTEDVVLEFEDAARKLGAYSS